MSVIEKERGTDDTGSKRPKMWHIVYVLTPEVGLCGAKLNGTIIDNDSARADCIVCLDLARAEGLIK